MDRVYHIYIGTKYQGPQRGRDEQHAILMFATRVGKSPVIFQTKPCATIQDLKKAA